MTVYFEVSKQNDGLSNNENHVQIVIDRFVANNHGNQKYSVSYQNDFNTCLELYRT